jgi:hypothetical protein
MLKHPLLFTVAVLALSAAATLLIVLQGQMLAPALL